MDYKLAAFCSIPPFVQIILGFGDLDFAVVLVIAIWLVTFVAYQGCLFYFKERRKQREEARRAEDARRRRIVEEEEYRSRYGHGFIDRAINRIIHHRLEQRRKSEKYHEPVDWKNEGF
jgi:hypothetical protein